MEQETDGVLQVGEVPVVVRRNSPSEEDYEEARRSGRHDALREMMEFMTAAESSAPPFSDTRPYENMRSWIADKMRENRG